MAPVICFKMNVSSCISVKSRILFKSFEVISSEQWNEEVHSSKILIFFIHSLYPGPLCDLSFAFATFSLYFLTQCFSEYFL